MMYLILLFSLYTSYADTPINLTNDETGIVCSSDSASVRINATDSRVYYKGLTYVTSDFLDKALTARAIVPVDGGHDESWVFFHMINQSNKAILISGDKISFNEFRCDDQVAFKECSLPGIAEMTYSPTDIMLQYDTQVYDLPLRHYLVYPNDGNSWIYYDGSLAAAVVDFGSEFKVIAGEHKLLTCSYED